MLSKEIEDNKCCVATANKKLAAIHHSITVLEELRLIPVIKNASYFRESKKKKTIEKPILKKNSQALSVASSRDKLIYYLMTTNIDPLKPEEIINIEASDVLIGNNDVHVKVNDKIAQYKGRDVVKLFRSLTSESTGYLFTNLRTKKRISRTSIYTILKKYQKEVK